MLVEADGGARGNPGPAGYGAVVREANTGEVLAERAEALGVATNNVAEYSGLLAGLQAAADLGAVEVEVRMDSKLVVEQMSGRWQIKHPGLRPLAAQAATLVRRFDQVTFTWIPRERNRHADALANKAMDAAAGKTDPPGNGQPVGKGQPAAPAAGSPRRSWEPPATTPTRLILVRHGATELTAQRRYSGRGDVPLSDVGLAQARATGVRVAALAPSVAAVVTSPLSRCTRTAEEISAALDGAPVEVEPDLVECDFGAWEGRTFADVRAQWPDEMDAWLGSTEEAPPGGESFRAVATRVRRVMAMLQKGYPESTVVVVSHVSPLKILLRDALGAGDAFLHRLYLDPAGLSIVDTWPDGGVAVRSVNETAHLA
ncbi:bifunctional RNase H/acid phosphatase [Phytohabitans rumicis]|uniref:Bifunctional RNase H/acid phosphatase n=1 Tax=Phytohabitans rumicis TaxID=1076125 RepID=A0A6V8L7U6_9ACTN|nr:bifunctional RNase H/acid phosphatase [Phytohabitans rumicis]